MRSIALLASLAVCACAPYYRDDERLVRDATDSRRETQTLAAAEHEHAAGNDARAAELLHGLIATNPLASVDVYLRYGEYATAAGLGARARAVIQFRLDEATPADESERQRLVDFLAATPAVIGVAADSGVSAAEDEERALARDLAAVTDVTTASGRAADAVLDLKLALDTYDRDDMREYFERWLDAYGVPDHDALNYGAGVVRDRLWAKTEPEALALIAHGAELAAAGDTRGALVLLTRAHRLVPWSERAIVFPTLARVAATVTDVAATDPVAYQLALDGDQALERGEIYLALHSYRRAVAHAPWWATARRNLAAIFDAIGRADAAADHRKVADELVGAPPS